MLMQGLLRDSRPLIEELLWSLWTELGAPGWDRRHQDWWIDPEALILFTATLDPISPRLRDEAIAWCLRQRRFLSNVRIKSLLQTDRFFDPALYQPQISRFLTTASMGRAPEVDDAIEPYPFQARTPALAHDMTRPAMLSLRLRSLLGVTAKAEIVRVLLAHPGAAFSATDLVNEHIGYTKRAVRDALEDLRLGGIVEVEEAGNRKEYLVRESRSLTALLEPGQLRFPRWWALFAVLRGLLDLGERIDEFRPATRPIEIRRTFAALRTQILAAGLPFPALAAGSNVMSELETWVAGVLEALTAGQWPGPGSGPWPFGPPAPTPHDTGQPAPGPR